MMSTTADYRAVAPDAKSYVITNVVRHFQLVSIYDLKSDRYQFHGNNDIAHFSNCIFFISGETQAERRKQVIQESKYLGGDMEHTHLVKGLDYALLDKVIWRCYVQIEKIAKDDESEWKDILISHCCIKVRAEITSKETELLDDESLEKIIKEKV